MHTDASAHVQFDNVERIEDECSAQTRLHERYTSKRRMHIDGDSPRSTAHCGADVECGAQSRERERIQHEHSDKMSSASARVQSSTFRAVHFLSTMIM